MSSLQNFEFWYNGTPRSATTLELSLTDPALLYGATVFTTVRIYDRSLHHRLTHWTHHCDRLRHTIAEFGWQPPDWQRVRQGAEWVMQFYPVLRITLFPDGREWITGRHLPTDLRHRQEQGIAAWLSDRPWHRSLPHHKTGNYLAPWLTLQTAQSQSAQEAILTNAAGDWLETSTGNLWGYGDDGWYTPPLEMGILPGLQRQALIEHLMSQRIAVYEIPWTRSLIQTFHGIAYSNCVVELIPIQSVIMGEERLKFSPDPSVWHPLRSYFFNPA